MSGLLESKAAIITGASSGLGKGIARVFAREGADIVVTYHSNKKGIEGTVRELENLGGRVLPLQADITDLKSIDSMIATTLEKLGRIDILVNNAGITTKYPFLEITEGEFDEMLSINFKGTYFCSQKAARIMIKQGGGKIINISSLTAKSSFERFTAYSASKAAINKFTAVAAIELGPYNVQGNAIAAGWIPVESEPEMTEKQIEIARKYIPVGRLGTPDDIGEIAAFLGSSRSDYMTGETVYADGGQSQVLSIPSAVDKDYSEKK